MTQNKKLEQEQREHEPQPWLDQSRELAYSGVKDEMASAAESGRPARETLRAILEYATDASAPYLRRFKKIISDVDSEAIKYGLITSQSASEVSGTEITRAMFVVTDHEVYDRLEEVFTGQPGSSEGIVLPPGLFNGLPHFRDVGVILAKTKIALWATKFATRLILIYRAS